MLLRFTNKGFTLLEILLAATLLATGLVILLQAISIGQFVGTQNENEVVAINLAQEKAEELRNKTYSSLSSEAKAVVTGFPGYQRAVDILTPQTNLKQVTVTVYWFAKDKETSIALVTYVSNI